MSVHSNHSRNRIAEYLMIVMTIYLGLELIGVLTLVIISLEWFDWTSQWRITLLFGNSAGPTAFCFMALQITMVVMVCTWMSRAFKNLLGVGVRTKFGPFSAGLSWFIPLANLWMPFQAIKEIINKNSELIRFFGKHRNEGIVHEAEIQRVASIWWGFWVLTLPFSFGLGFYFLNLADDSFGWDKWAMFLAVGVKVGLDFILGILTIRMLRQIRVLEDEVYELWDSGVIQRYQVEKRNLVQQELSEEEGDAVSSWYDTEATPLIYPSEDLFVK